MITKEVVAWLERETGIAILPESARGVSGGCINDARLVDRMDGGSVFLKINSAAKLNLFEAEKRCLDLLSDTRTIRVPMVHALGIIGGSAILALEGLDLRSGGGPGSQEKLAERLSALHDHFSPNGQFGLNFDNFIGATPQPNGWAESWADFYVEQRLEHQFRLAAGRGRNFSDAARVLSVVRDHLASLDISPSLLHGDLWGGNVGFLTDSEPVVYDPASYHGDREADLAFTRMFGGFGPGFYRRYRELVPAPEPVRETIYNLYHLLNHYNLFGGGYASQAESAMREILREIG